MDGDSWVSSIYSKRLRNKEKAGSPDVYQYETVPEALRVQVIHIWRSAMGDPREASMHNPDNKGWWEFIHDTLARELGVFALSRSHSHAFDRCQDFMLRAETLPSLDLIEISFRVADRIARKVQHYERRQMKLEQTPDEAIEELNHRSQEHGIGYQYAEGEIVRVDSQYLHREAVKPAQALLQDPEFVGASEEFVRAHANHGMLPSRLSRLE